MSRLLYPFCRSTSAVRSLLPSVFLLIVLAGLALALPVGAAAQAVPGPESKQGSSGLPDGRVYEEVTPTNKIAGEAGQESPIIISGVDGDEVEFSTTASPVGGETPTGYSEFAIARRLASGWKTHSAVPRGEGTQGAFFSSPEHGLGFSTDLTGTVFGANDTYLSEQIKGVATPHLYIYSEDGLVQWVGKPLIAEPVTFGFAGSGQLAGTSPDLKTVYFAYEGALTPTDEEPNPTLGGISRAQQIKEADEAIENEVPGSGREGGNDGFYEWDEGSLKAAGVLPDGHLDPYGAAPAATVDSTNYSAESLDNQVSEDGSKAFFVSPDPVSHSERPVELYVRETAPDGAHKTVLVSRDLLLPEEQGLPASAPDGVVVGAGGGQSYAYASADGSHVFFESTDQLTEAAPSGTTIKAYEFDTNANTLVYLPGVADLSNCTNVNCSTPSIAIFAGAQDGSNFMFVREGELDLWHEGAVTEIGSVEGRPSVARATRSGSEYAFQTKAPFTGMGFNNGGGEHSQVYVYQVAGDTLGCASCPPAGVQPSGDAELSHAFPSGGHGNTGMVIAGTHSMSEDGSQVFFDTPDPLVQQDTNGVRDAYEWQSGTVYLISTGVAKGPSFFGDNSPSGDDVFFSTLEGIAPGDTDGSYDVYDARVPRPGDQLPPSAVPCEGAVCQGPPGVPQLLGQPASEAFNGVGDLTLTPTAKTVLKSLSRKQKLARALKACKRKRNKSKRAACERQAHRTYGASASSTRRGKTSRHNLGRGK